VYWPAVVDTVIAVPPVGELVGSLPDQPSVPSPPEAVQAVAPLTAQLRSIVAPTAGVVEEAVSAVVKVGAVSVVEVDTTSVAVAVALKPELLPSPAQVRVYS
jgi:hypothetical protein